MTRVFPVLLVVLLGVGAAIAIRAQFAKIPATPARVPDGDAEVAYIHTTTNPQTWERFVAGVLQAGRQVPGLEVDDSRAFLDQPAAVPEVVVSRKGRPGKLRFRWYKLSSEVGNREWVAALAARQPPPIAFMGGGTSDRAIELAVALNEREAWAGGPRPLLVVTTATANLVEPEPGRKVGLLSLYPGRTFRGCFTNEAMAEAVVDFVGSADEFRPTARPDVAAHVIAWQDDPYSVDLADEFVERLRERKDRTVRTVLDRVPYSVGTFTEPNPVEREVMDRIVPDIPTGDGDRTLLVLPAVTQPARRILRAFAADSPLIGKHLVAITGDGVSFNTTYRDSDVAWPVRELSIPLVFFAHQNPVAWDRMDDQAGVPLPLRSSTDDVLLFADEVRVVAEAVFGPGGAKDADELAARLRAREPAFFTPAGERRPGAGEHVVVVRPQFLPDGRVHREAVFDVYGRRAGTWERVQRLVK
ncbi:MAG TPA: hypothetical protein VM597_32720 [Gemmataceae bacterium]|jgi:hypothetical protein|nr:hypothetical protein [Gemmataceae bacterium]